MCPSCATTASPAGTPADRESPDHGLSRRRLLAGLGVGALTVNLSAGAFPAAAAAAAAAAKNGAWANPALGRFPAGGHYGAPRGGASHASQDVSNSTGTAVHAAAGATVVVIQHLMNQRGHGPAADGSYGPLSVEAVKRFQRSEGLAADGQVGPATWPVLVHTLRQGASGSHVRALQTALNRRGARLAVDGGFGSVTTSAVRAYQSGNRLVADGEAGPVTWRALTG